MALIEWGPQLEVGFGDIDVQHQRLVRLLNELEEAAASSDDPHGQLGQVLAELVRYTQVHFAFEEHLMATYALEGHEASRRHREEHRALTGQVLAYRDRFVSGEAELDADVLAFLRDWLRSHILGTDRGFARALIDAGAHSAA